MKPPSPITLPKVKQLIRSWQRDLRLRDWEIVSALSTMEKLGDAYGECQAELHNRTAYIQIATDMPPWMLEQVVVHELLHCHTAALPAISAEAQQTAEEQIISTVSELLAKWRPAKTPPKRKAD